MSIQAMRLRDALVSQLVEAGMVRSPRVEAAMRAVPRHVFLPGVPLRRAYANDVVQTKRDADGVPISAASQPSIVGAMLEQLDIEPGSRILEIGAGTGYNAALLACLAGPGGEVVTIDVDEDIVAAAQSALAAASTAIAEDTANVTVLRGDGALGAPGFAPFDRIIATVGTRDLPLAWQEQLAPGGRIVVPLRLLGSVTRSIAFASPDHGSPGKAELRSVSSEMCGFMPLRASIASDPRRVVPLAPSGDATLEVQQEQDADPRLLAGILDTERVTVPTGVGLADAASAEWLYLWLTCTLPGGLFGVTVRPPAGGREVMAPMFRWGAMAAVARDSLAYLTFSPARMSGGKAGGGEAGANGDGADAEGGGELREISVIGHGPRAPELAGAVARQVRAWDRDYRTRTAEFTIRPLTDSEKAAADETAKEHSAGTAEATDTGVTGVTGAREHAPGEFTIRTPNNLITISWANRLPAAYPVSPGRVRRKWRSIRNCRNSNDV
ncbi:MAG: methyltransferase, FxLD system [Nocardiopsaceae bacterium]|nr:methyltransferase, FxLD system [Nocardiopsaceae bacterium]